MYRLNGQENLATFIFNLTLPLSVIPQYKTKIPLNIKGDLHLEALTPLMPLLSKRFNH